MRSVACSIDDKFVVVRIYDHLVLIDIHLLGLVKNVVVLLLLGLLLRH